MPSPLLRDLSLALSVTIHDRNRMPAPAHVIMAMQAEIDRILLGYEGLPSTIDTWSCLRRDVVQLRAETGGLFAAIKPNPHNCPADLAWPFLQSMLGTDVPALSIRQPWAWLVAKGFKTVENRRRNTSHRGLFYIHAPMGMTQDEYEHAKRFAAVNGITVPAIEDLQLGAIIGYVNLTATCSFTSDKWFEGPHGYLLEHAVETPRIPCKGQRNFFIPKP